MKLQGAIFDFDSSLLDGEGNPLPGLEAFLFLMKLEDVWMFVSSERDRPGAQEALKKAGLAAHFKGVMAADEYRCNATQPEFYEKVIRRLRTAPKATAIFTAREEVLRPLAAAGYPVVLVGAGHAPELQALAVDTVPDYRDMSKLPE